MSTIAPFILCSTMLGLAACSGDERKVPSGSSAPGVDAATQPATGGRAASSGGSDGASTGGAIGAGGTVGATSAGGAVALGSGGATAPGDGSVPPSRHGLYTSRHLGAAIAVDDASVYWSETEVEPDGGGVLESIRGMPKGGGAVTTVASVPGGSTVAMVVRGGTVYWMDENAVVGYSLGSKLFRAPASGGVATELWEGDFAGGITVDDAAVYFPTTSLGQILKIPLEGGSPATLANRLSQPYAIASDAANVYWTSPRDGQLMKVSKSGGAPVALASNLSNPWAIAVYGAFVYFTEAQGCINGKCNGQVRRVSVDGGDPVPVATQQDGPVAVAVDAGGVYFHDSHAGPPDAQKTLLAWVPLDAGPDGGTVQPIAIDYWTLGPFDLALDATSVFLVATDPATSTKSLLRESRR